MAKEIFEDMVRRKGELEIFGKEGKKGRKEGKAERWVGRKKR